MRKGVLGLPDYQELLKELQGQGLDSDRERLQVRLTASARDRVVAIVLDHIQAGGGSVSEWVKEALLMRIGLLNTPVVEEETTTTDGEELSRDVIQRALLSFGGEI